MAWSDCNGTIIIYDPESGTHNLGKLRASQFDWKDGNPNDSYPEERVKKLCWLQFRTGAQQ